MIQIERMYRPYILVIAVLVSLLLLPNTTVLGASNNSLQTATAIDLNRGYSDTLGSSSERHFYKIEVPEDGNISPQMNRVSNHSWYITVMDESGKVFKEFYTDYRNIVSGQESRDIGVPAGTYYISVSSYTSAAGVPYQFEVKYESSPYFEKEFNNTLQTASMIQINQPYSGGLQSSSDQDFFTFTLPSDGKITVSMDRQTDRSWYLTVMDGKGNVFKEFYTDYRNIVSGQESRDIGLPAGTYFLKVSNYTSAADIPYHFTVHYEISDYYEKEFNHSLQTANPIQTNQTYTGFLQSSSDQDFYSFTLTEAGKVTINMNRETDHSWYVLVTDGKANGYKEFYTDYRNIVTGKEQKEIGLPPGTYHIRVSNYTSAVDLPYELEVEFEKGPYFEKEFNHTLLTANPILLNKTYSGTLQSSSDTDFYQFSLRKDSTITLEVEQRSGISWYVTVLDGSGKVYKQFYTQYSNVVEGSESIDLDLPQGDYYIKVNNYTSAIDTPYFFRVLGDGGDSNINDGFEPWESQFNVPVKKEWTVTFNVPVDRTTITEQNIYITDEKNEVVPILYIIDRSRSASQLTLAPVKNYTSGKTYTLWIKDIKSESGTVLNKNVKMSFTIQ